MSKYVSNLVKVMHNKYWDGYIPVRFSEFLKGLNIKLYEKPDIGDGAVSEILFDDNQWKIFVSLNEPYVRKRFALAHSIGHIVLGHVNQEEKHTDNVEDFLLNSDDAFEKEANQFALELLCPENAIDLVVLKSKNFDDLCDKLELSPVAVNERIKHILDKV